MKRIVLLTIAISTTIATVAQTSLEEQLKVIEDTTSVNNSRADSQVDIETVDTTAKVSDAGEMDQGTNGLKESRKTVHFPDDADSVVIRIGNRQIIFIEKGNSVVVDLGKKHSNRWPWEDDYQQDREYKHVSKPKFKGHWAGFEWGFNGFLTPDHSFSLNDDVRYLEVRQARSWNLNLNLMQYSLGIISDKVGLVTGMGLEFNNYHFRNKTTIKLEDGMVVADSSFIGSNLSKNKLSTFHLTAPLLLEFQFPNKVRGERVYISGGVIGGVRLGSSIRITDETNGKDKIKKRDDFNIQPFRYGITARVGYKHLQLFANYYPMGMFEKGRGPEVYPFSIGLVVLDFS